MNNWVGNKINFRVGPQEPPLATVEKLPWFRCVTRHSRLSRTILRGTLEGRRYRVSRGNAGLTTSKSGHPFPCQNCSQWPPAEKTELSLLSPDDRLGQRTELNWRNRGQEKSFYQHQLSLGQLDYCSKMAGDVMIHFTLNFICYYYSTGGSWVWGGLFSGSMRSFTTGKERTRKSWRWTREITCRWAVVRQGLCGTGHTFSCRFQAVHLTVYFKIVYSHDFRLQRGVGVRSFSWIWSSLL